MFVFSISWHKLLYTGHLASFTTTVQICDWNNSHMMFYLIFCAGETVQTWNEGDRQSQGYHCPTAGVPNPLSVIHFVARVISARRTPITRPRYKERTYLSTSLRMGFQQRSGPRTTEILVSRCPDKLFFGSASNPGIPKLLLPH